MRWVEVTTQKQLDALKDNEAALIKGSGFFELMGNRVAAAYGSSTVRACDSSTVTAYDSSTVRAYDSSTVTAYDSSTVTAYGSSTVTAYDSSTVRAYDSSTVTAYGSSTVTAYGSSTVRAYDSSTVTAYGSSTVTAYGSSTVTAYDSSTVTACGSSTVTASAYVAVHKLSQHADLSGGVIIEPPEVKTGRDFCDFYGIEVKRGRAVMFKAVHDDWQGGHKKKGITYRPGDKPKAPDWDPYPSCGGGLHLSPRPFMALAYNSDATHFVACSVLVKDVVVIGDKVKVPTCNVLHEVDEDGNKLVVEASA